MKWIAEAVAKLLLWHRHKAVLYICMSLHGTQLAKKSLWGRPKLMLVYLKNLGHKLQQLKTCFVNCRW